MAEFSKQYCEIWDPEFPWDFDIDKIAEELTPGHYYSTICEGFGFTAIAKEEDGNILLYFPDWEFTGVANKAHWVEYERFMELESKKALKLD